MSALTRPESVGVEHGLSTGPGRTVSGLRPERWASAIVAHALS